MKNYLISTFLLLLQLFMIVKSIMDEYIDPFTIILYYGLILITAYVFTKLLSKWMIVLPITLVYCILLFILIFNSKAAQYQLKVNQSEEAFLKLPVSNISEVRIVARPIYLKKYYHFRIYKKERINELLSSLKHCEKLSETGTHLFGYYALTFIDDNHQMYSFELLKNCAIPNDLRSPLCNRIYVRFNPIIDVFNLKEPDLEVAVFYKCDGIVSFLQKHVDSLIEQNPEKINGIIY